ncbi:MAG: hypothetical protein V4736_03220 [Bdellovibrionota bacterium]
MKTLALILFLFSAINCFGNPQLQEKLFQSMQNHQEAKGTDQVFTEEVLKLKADPQWSEDQNLFLKDYLDSLSEKRQQSLANLMGAESETESSNAPMDLNEAEKEKPTVHVAPSGAWKKWVLGVVGVALFFTPYKLVFYAL